MITKINLINPTINNIQNKKKYSNTNPIQHNNNNSNLKGNSIQGIPVSYINFRASKIAKEESEIKLSSDGQNSLKRAKEIAKRYNHAEITPFHIILADIENTEEKINYIIETGTRIEDGATISTLHALANDFAKRDVLQNLDECKLFIEETQNLKNKVLNELGKYPKKTSKNQKIDYSEPLKSELADVKAEINAYMLSGVAFNTLTLQGNTISSDYLKKFQDLGLYKSSEELSNYYLECFDSKAIEAWNKLALGSNLFVLAKTDEDKKRITTSFIKTIDETKHGNFNSKNTLVFPVTDDADPEVLIKAIEENMINHPNDKLIYMIDLDKILPNFVQSNSESSIEYKSNFFEFISLPEGNTKFIFLQNEKDNYELMLAPQIKKIFNNFINYNVPSVQSYEVNKILKKNKHLLEGVNKPFMNDAREKTILLAEKMEGSYPEKAVELMKRISEYYGDEVKRITVKDVEEFAFIAGDIFKQDEDITPIVYNTGKTLATYYGKETTQKDIENIVKQIKTGRIGTQGYIMTAKDEEAGTGKKYTAEVIAGEAKVPFLEISSSDFATSSYEDDASSKITPAMSMAKIFSDVKLAAKQNPYKTAIIYINNFEDLVFSDSFYTGYKQAKTQLSREMEKAIKDDINILIIGSTQESYAEYIPMFIKDFSQNIVVDSPAFNKKSRKDVLTNIIAKEKLPLSYKTKSEKEDLIEKLVKITEYCSYVQIKNLISKTQQIMLERDKNKAGIGEFIEAYLQLETGRTSQPEMPMYNKMATTSHECGHATNLEIMNRLYESKGQPWHKSRDIHFITLDPRGNFLGAVFEGKTENTDYPFEAMFSDLVCSYGGYSCEKLFFNMDGSSGISQDLAQATAAVQRAIEYFGLGYYTGKISNAVKINSGAYFDNVYKDMEIILTNAQIASDLITEGYKDFNIWFTNKYSKLIGSDNCMIDGDEFRKQLTAWIASQPAKVKEELAIIDDMILDIIKASKNGKLYYQAKKVIK